MSSVRRSPRQQRSRETVDAVLEAAAQLFERHGYAATTNHIAERAGVSIGSVYQYFPNKESLVEEIARLHIHQVLSQLDQLFAELEQADVGLRELLETLICAVAAAHADRPALHRFLFEEAPRTPALILHFRTMEREIAEALAIHLRRLDLGGEDPVFTALLTVQGVEAQVHGALLEESATEGLPKRVWMIVDLWTRALTF